MKVIKAQFLKGVVGEEAILYDGTPHIAFIGRSNVGKSSTLNRILERKNLVKTGKTPGKTKEINFFNIELGIPKENQVITLKNYFVDLPGYGYAKLGKKDREKLSELIQWYISHPEADTLLIGIIIDAKAGLTELDKGIIDTLENQSKSYFLAINKTDKINQKEQSMLIKEINKIISSEKDIIFYSAFTGKNINKIQDKVSQSLEQYYSNNTK